MSTITVDRRLTLAEFHELPEDDSIERELIRGCLREEPMTRRNRWHADVEAWIAHLLNDWRSRRPEPRGRVFSGEVGCDLPSVETAVGIDVAYFSADTLASQPEDGPYLVGAPVLAVEILSPSDTVERIRERINLYLDAGTDLAWFVEPQLRTITVYRSDDKPRVYSGDDELTADPFLPDFCVPVSRVFEH